jgi:hypothetical protein
MPDTSQYWREVDNMSDIEYLYGNYSGKSALDKKIKKAEEMLNQQRQNAEDNLERLYDQENMARLKAMNVKDMTFDDVELFNEIRKKYSNVDKAYDGSPLSDFPQAAGVVPNTTEVKAAIINTLNDWIPLVRNRGVSVQPIHQEASLQNILAFCNSFRDAFKNSQAPVSEPEDYNEDIKFSKSELLVAKKEIERMLNKLDGR